MTLQIVSESNSRFAIGRRSAQSNSAPHRPDAENWAHFLAAAEAMRRIPLDIARGKLVRRHGTD